MKRILFMISVLVRLSGCAAPPHDDSSAVPITKVECAQLAVLVKNGSIDDPSGLDHFKIAGESTERVMTDTCRAYLATQY